MSKIINGTPVLDDSPEKDHLKYVQLEAHGYAEEIFNKFDIESLKFYSEQFKSSIIQLLSEKAMSIIKQSENLNLQAQEITKLIETLKQ